MQKINLEALESKNMTVAIDDTLSEINGGCAMHAVYFCGKSVWTDFEPCYGGSEDCSCTACSKVREPHMAIMKKVFNDFRGDFKNVADMSVTKIIKNRRDFYVVSVISNDKNYTYYYPLETYHAPY